MTDGLEAARARRNALERLGERIPGFRGFQDRELRREVDRLEREHIASELTRLKGRLRDAAGRFTDAGRIAALRAFERLDQSLEGLAQAVRFADYGLTGLFDAVKIREEDLERLYELDLSLLADLEGLGAAIKALPPPEDGEPAAALEDLRSRTQALREKWARRGAVVSGVGSP